MVDRKLGIEIVAEKPYQSFYHVAVGDQKLLVAAWSAGGQVYKIGVQAAGQAIKVGENGPIEPCNRFVYKFDGSKGKSPVEIEERYGFEDIIWGKELEFLDTIMASAD